MKRRGFSLVGVLISIALFMLISFLGFVVFKNIEEKNEIRRAKTIIYETFTTYCDKSFRDGKSRNVKFDYLKKELHIYEYGVVLKEKVELPKKLNYTTIFEQDKTDKFLCKITKNGNITPSFSIYIFDYGGIAQYRLSFYSFDVLRYLKINIYKNRGDKTPTLEKINDFHKIWTTSSEKWAEE